MTGNNVALRAPEPADIDLLHRWENNRSLWYAGTTLAPYSRYQIEQYVLSEQHDIFAARQLRFMIDRLDNKQVQTVGTIDLFDFDPLHRRAGVGILISEAHRQSGMATEALQLLMEYAFQTLQLHQLYCHIATDNQPSMALFTSAGFSLSGTLKEWRLRELQWIDEHILQCINPHPHG